jgi:aldehyde:ferredoxin oxidoreductase
METAVDATGTCNDLSLCTIKMYNSIDWLARCQKAGVLADKDTGLDMSQLGTRAFFEKLAHMIAHREGFGELLAEGLMRAGKTLERIEWSEKEMDSGNQGRRLLSGQPRPGANQYLIPNQALVYFAPLPQVGPVDGKFGGGRERLC